MFVNFVDSPELITTGPSIFLAGPTPRNILVPSWRPEAISCFERFGFTGSLFLPERLKMKIFNWETQVVWEAECMKAADCILFWIPREIETMPGFNTNVEWGRWESSGKVVLGFPPDAKKMGYIKYYAMKNSVPIADTLEQTVKIAIEMANKHNPVVEEK